jgi:hypothetical protein
MKRSVLFLLPFAACTADGLNKPVSQIVGTSGAQIAIGTLQDPELAGTLVVIPPGAITVDTTITISRGADQVAAGEFSLSPSVRLSPDGLALARPATLFVVYNGQPFNTSLGLAVTSAGKRSEPDGGLTVSQAAGLAQVQINHFGDWEIIARNCPESSTDLAQPYPVDFAYSPADLGSGANDLAPSSNLGGDDSGQSDLAPSEPSGDDGGTLADPSGYVAPAACGDNTPVDFAVAPRG